MPLPPVLNSIVAWLRAGYPEGVPDVDYVPLFALLASELTDNDVNLIAEDLETSSDSHSGQQAISSISSSSPSLSLSEFIIVQGELLEEDEDDEEDEEDEDELL